MTKPYLIMENISKTYPGVNALDRVSLSIYKGEIHALVGENGAGKSTLIKILAGVIRPDPGGKFEIDGDVVEFRNAAEANKQGISVNYQDLSLFPNLTVAENITIGQTSTSGFRVKWKEMRLKAKNALDRLGLSMDLDIPLEKLSIAKQQLVSIARAIAFEAKLIVLDEPTSSLSSGEVEVLFRIIRELSNKGMSILFVSHKLDELFAVADRFTVLRDGQFVGCYDRE
jgi:ABC-type sugar transport system ATPase subunit